MALLSAVASKAIEASALSNTQNDQKQVEQAATTIQRFFRGYKARERTISAIFTSSWKVLDVAEENQLEQHSDALNAIENILLKKKLSVSSPAVLKQPVFKTEPEAPLGATIALPITKEGIEKLIVLFKNNKYVARSCVEKVCEEALKVLEAEDTLKKLRIKKPDHRCTVVGDLHGQLPDLLTILSQNGFPSEGNWYVFNGDFVDRGPNSVEVILLLYCLKILYPDYVHLNRGNHEHRRLNFKYNFQSEVLRKYDMDIYDLFQETFNMLPLGVLVNKKALIVHGGLFEYEDVTISEIKKINRKRELPRHKEIKTREDRIMEQLLWSDPQDGSGVKENARGAGILFGPDITEAFMRKNGVSLIVRSHEMMEEGYATTHSGSLVTVFSASNYCGCNSNKGAVIIFKGGKDVVDYETKQYYADLLELGASEETYRAKRIENCKQITVQMLKEKIHENRHNLFAAFSRLQEQRQQAENTDGIVTRLDWAGVMADVLRLPLPWLKLQPYLAVVDTDTGGINYLEFLDRYQIKVEGGSTMKKQWEREVIHRICSKMYEGCRNIFLAFNECDTNHDGKVTYEELLVWLKKYEMGLTEHQAYELMRYLDRNKTGYVNLKEFVDRLQDEYLNIQHEATGEPQDGTLKEMVDYISQKLHKRSETGRDSIRSIFKKAFKAKKPHSLTHRDFSHLLKAEFGHRFHKKERHQIAEYLDHDHDGFVCWSEFKSIFHASSKKEDLNKWADALVERICSFFYHNSVELRYAFQAIDTNNSGKIDINEFKTALEALNLISNDHALSDSQVKKLFKEIDADADGNIDYQEFLRSFRLVDITPTKHSLSMSNLKPRKSLAKSVSFQSDKHLPTSPIGSRKDKQRDHKEHRSSSKDKSSKGNKEHKDHNKERNKERKDKEKASSLIT